MSLLGVSFFSGLISTAPDMQDSLDTYLDNSNSYNINIISTLGLITDDIKVLNDVEGVDDALGIKSIEILGTLENNESIIKIIEYNNEINIPNLLDGRFPENNNEILIDSYYNYSLELDNLIGKTLTVNYAENENLLLLELFKVLFNYLQKKGIHL